MTSPANELRAAATKLTNPLPGDLNATPRLVMTDAETVSGIAFCVDHQLPRDEEHEYSACDYCEVIDCKYAALAELILGLLVARMRGADLLEDAAKALPDAAVSPDPRFGEQVMHALRFARALNGGQQS